MSVGLFRHPTLGETKKYILNNKHVLEIKTDTKQTEEWSRQLATFRDSFLRNKKLKFYLLPEEVYVDREAAYEYEENSRGDSMRVIVYEHYIVTLKEELQMRIKAQEPFAKKELWFLLYAFVCGAMEMMQIREFTRSSEEIEINPETILLNQYGYVKLMGQYSSPFPIKPRGSFRTPESNLSSEAVPHKLQICYSSTLGRILASLILLRQMQEFIDGKQRLFSDAKLLQELKPFEERLGILYSLIRMMLSDNLNERLMVSEVKALLLPYEEQILALNDFTLDKEVSRESLLALFVSQ